MRGLSVDVLNDKTRYSNDKTRNNNDNSRNNNDNSRNNSDKIHNDNENSWRENNDNCRNENGSAVLERERTVSTFDVGGSSTDIDYIESPVVSMKSFGKDEPVSV